LPLWPAIPHDRLDDPMYERVTMARNFMKSLFIKFMRSKAWQPIWESLHHYSLIGMNFWGGASVTHSGEAYAIRYVSSKFASDRPLVIFDVGANLGQFAMMCVKNIKQPKRIYSFEPSINTFHSLKDIVQKCRYDAFILPIHAGISDTPGRMRLYSSEPNSSIASVYNLKNPLREFNESLTEDIDVVTVDDFCSDNQIEFIDYLKIDIEGHEFKALLGCQRMLSEKRIRFIQFEFGEGHIDSRTFFRDFYDLLHDKYNFYRIVSDGLVKIPRYSSELEIFATINYFAELK